MSVMSRPQPGGTVRGQHQPTCRRVSFYPSSAATDESAGRRTGGG
jgi:hypothetical protein